LHLESPPNTWRGSPAANSTRTRSPAPTAATGRCATTAPTSKPSSSAAPRPSTTRSPPSTTSTSAAASDPRPPRESTPPSRRRARSTNTLSFGTSEQSRRVRRHATRRSRWSRSTFYAGARISEIVALDIDDVARSARKGVLRILGKGERLRQVPLHPQLHAALNGWLAERADWPGADTPALFLNQRGERLSVRGAHAIITGIAAAAGLDDDTTVHILRHTFATTLVRGGTDLVIVAELLGHARLETTRIYTRPSAEDRIRALDLLPVDE
ncbi:MAG: tyrosine-type recombinase/integrase, partial [Solirubrobacteraceae bacterium]